MKLAILTSFREWNDAYSLTHVVRAQALTLAKHGHEVTVFAMSCCPGFAHDFPWHFWFDCSLPNFEPHLYETAKVLSEEHKEYAVKLSKILAEKLLAFDAVITHDWIVTGPNLPFAEALRLCAPKLTAIPFMHWIHSTPNYGHYDWWNIHRYGKNHKIIYQNKTDSDFVALTFKGTAADVRVIPPIVDLRIDWDFSQETCEILEAMPGLMQAEFVQVYPAAADRLRDKGVRELIITLKNFKKKGRSICLLIVDSWGGAREREDPRGYQRIIDNAPELTPQDVCFSSSLLNGKYKNGLPWRILRELLQCSSVFVWPTKGESFGMAGPRAALASGAMPIFNRNLSMHFEVGGGSGLYANFGSSEQQWKPKSEKEYYPMLSVLGVSRADQESSLQYRNFVRRSFNADRVYRFFYEPILTEAVQTWV